MSPDASSSGLDQSTMDVDVDSTVLYVVPVPTSATSSQLSQLFAQVRVWCAALHCVLVLRLARCLLQSPIGAAFTAATLSVD